MFNKQLKDELYILRKEIGYLKDEMWDNKYPFGIVEIQIDMFSNGVYFKPNRRLNILVHSLYGGHYILKGYKIKKTDSAYYIELTLIGGNDTFVRTYIIVNEVITNIDKLCKVEDFDIEKNFNK